MKKVISTTKAPSAIGPYSQAIQVGNIIYTSGQIPIDPATGSFVEGGIKEQTRQSLLNVKACGYERCLCRVFHRAIPCKVCRCRKNFT